MTIERAFGVLTARWRILSHKVYIHDQMDINDIITSCCILHNICIEREEEHFEIEATNTPHNDQLIDDGVLANEDDRRREEIFRQLFQ